MHNMTGIRSSTRVLLASVAAGVLLAFSEPTPASATGCGVYTECLEFCPTQWTITDICADHQGSSCQVASAECSWSIVCFGPRVVCKYSELGGGGGGGGVFPCPDGDCL